MQTPFSATVLSVLLVSAGAATAGAQDIADGAQPARYAVVLVPTLGGSGGTAIGLNEAGRIAGSAENGQNLPHAVVWSMESGLEDLDPGSPGLGSEASGINDLGDVVGYRQTAAFGRFRATLWTAAGSRLDLPAPSNVDSYAVAVNDAGGIIGTVGTSYSQAAYWDASLQLQMLPSQGNVSVAWDINDSGVIAGVAASSPGSWIADRAALWRVDPNTGLVSEPEFLGGTGQLGHSEARAINERGVVVGGMQRGYSSVAFFSPPAATTEQRQLIEIVAPGEVAYSQAVDVNSGDQVVGVFGIRHRVMIDHAFHWSPGTGWLDLNNAIGEDAAREWILMHAASINDRGEIAGYGLFRGSFRAFLLLPVRGA